MEDIFMMLMMSAFFVIGYLLMKKLDSNIQEIHQESHQEILMLYDENHLDIKQYENENIQCFPKEHILELTHPYFYAILCTNDDFYNFMTHYQIHKSNQNCQVYSLCYDSDYYHLYQKEGIHLIRKEEIQGLLKELYEKNI